MGTAIALQIGLICLFLIGMVLWLAAPTGRPWGGPRCGVRRCERHDR